MIVFSDLGQAFGNLRAQKTRTLLTALGIVCSHLGCQTPSPINLNFTNDQNGNVHITLPVPPVGLPSPSPSPSPTATPAGRSGS